MNLKVLADEHLRAEFGLAFDATQPIPIRLREIERATELLDRDDRNDAQGIAEMKRQLADLRASLRCS
jgi:hypothetical protein